MKDINFCPLFMFIIISVLLSAGLSEATKESDDNCKLYFDDGDEFNNYWRLGVDLPAIEDTAKPGTIIAKYKSENLSYIDTISNPATCYIDPNFDQDLFFIKLYDDFVDYEKYETNSKLEIKINFECDNTRKREITFRLPINDTNNHAPEFLGAPYNFDIPMPIPKDYNFEQHGQIVARDIDLTNSHVTFVIKENEDSKGFSIVSGGKDKKDYPAKLTALQTLDLENDLTLVIFATDSGKPPLTSNTTVTITVDKKNSAPRFSHAFYTANLTKFSHKVNEIAVNFSQGIITLDRGYEGIKEFEINGISEENKKHLKLTHSGILRKDNIELQLKLVDLTEKFLSQRVVSFTIKGVKTSAEAETAVQILLPEIKSKDNTSDKIKGEQNSEKSDSSNGYMIATFILSLTTVGLTGSVIYLVLKKRYGGANRT